MKRYATVAWLALILLCPAPGRAQPAASAADLHAMLGHWFELFLDRSIDPPASGWSPVLLRGEPPINVAAQIVASPEYYVRSGGTPEGFVTTLYYDLTGQAPPPQELAALVPRARNDEQRKAAALALLQRYPQAWQLPADPGERGYLGGIREQIQRLTAAVENLQEDLVGELNGRKERDLYQRADAVLRALRQMRRGMRGGVERAWLHRQFQDMDRQLHELTDAAAVLDRDHPSLRRSLRRVAQADRDLHYAIGQGDPTPDRGRVILERQAQALAQETAEFQRTAQYVLRPAPARAGLLRTIDRLQEMAAGLAAATAAGRDREPLQRDFATFNVAWETVTRELARLPGPDNLYLYRRAERVDDQADRIHQLLEMRGDRPRRIFPARP